MSEATKGRSVASSGRPDDTREVLFLTPFHFRDPALDNAFDELLSAQLNGETEPAVVARHIDRIDTERSDYQAIQTTSICEAVRQASEDGFSSVVIACHFDPALEEAREVASIPVVGPLQLMTSLALQHGPKFAVITDTKGAEPVISELVNGYGVGSACVGVYSIGWGSDQILQDPAGAAELVEHIVDEIAMKGEAQSVVIGCTIVSAAYELNRDRFADRKMVVMNSNALSARIAAMLGAN